MARVILNGYDIESSQVLNEEDFLRLFREFKKGDKNAKDKLVMGNIKLVLSIVQKYKQPKCDLDDLFHTGIIGLLKALDGFDERYNVKFSTYAVPMIQGEIRRVVKDNGGIKIPRILRDISYKAVNFKKKFIQDNFRDPTTFEIASSIGEDEHNVIRAFESMSDVTSLYDEVYSNGEDSLTLMDQIKEDKYTLERMEDEIDLKNGMKRLPQKERQVLYLRYFLDKTQVEISSLIGISQAQVSRLENSALKKLRDIFA